MARRSVFELAWRRLIGTYFYNLYFPLDTSPKSDYTSSSTISDLFFIYESEEIL